MVVKKFGFKIPQYYRTVDKDVRIADIIHKTEEDFLVWAKNTFSKVEGRMQDKKGSLKEIDDKVYFCTREPYTGARVAVEVETASFLNHVSGILSITGCGRGSE